MDLLVEEEMYEGTEDNNSKQDKRAKKKGKDKRKHKQEELPEDLERELAMLEAQVGADEGRKKKKGGLFGLFGGKKDKSKKAKKGIIEDYDDYEDIDEQPPVNQPQQQSQQNGFAQPHPQNGFGQPHPQNGFGQPHPQNGFGQPHPQNGFGNKPKGMQQQSRDIMDDEEEYNVQTPGVISNNAPPTPQPFISSNEYKKMEGEKQMHQDVFLYAPTEWWRVFKDDIEKTFVDIKIVGTSDPTQLAEQWGYYNCPKYVFLWLFDERDLTGILEFVSTIGLSKMPADAIQIMLVGKDNPDLFAVLGKKLENVQRQKEHIKIAKTSRDIDTLFMKRLMSKVVEGQPIYKKQEDKKVKRPKPAKTGPKNVADLNLGDIQNNILKDLQSSKGFETLRIRKEITECIENNASNEFLYDKLTEGSEAFKRGREIEREIDELLERSIKTGEKISKKQINDWVMNKLYLSVGIQEAFSTKVAEFAETVNRSIEENKRNLEVKATELAKNEDIASTLTYDGDPNEEQVIKGLLKFREDSLKQLDDADKAADINYKAIIKVDELRRQELVKLQNTTRLLLNTYRKDLSEEAINTMTNLIEANKQEEGLLAKQTEDHIDNQRKVLEEMKFLRDRYRQIVRIDSEIIKYQVRENTRLKDQLSSNTVLKYKEVHATALQQKGVLIYDIKGSSFKSMAKGFIQKSDLVVSLVSSSTTEHLNLGDTKMSIGDYLLLPDPVVEYKKPGLLEIQGDLRQDINFMALKSRLELAATYFSSVMVIINQDAINNDQVCALEKELSHFMLKATVWTDIDEGRLVTLNKKYNYLRGIPTIASKRIILYGLTTEATKNTEYINRLYTVGDIRANDNVRRIPPSVPLIEYIAQGNHLKQGGEKVREKLDKIRLLVLGEM